MTTDVAAVLVDVSIKLAAAGALVWLATRRAGAGDAHRAHLVWKLLAASFVVLPAIELVAAPVWLVTPTSSLGRALLAVPSAAPFDLSVTALYGGPASLLLARVLIDVWRVRRFARESLRVEADADECAPVLQSIPRGIEVFETPSLTAPATAGCWPPRIFLPADWREADPAAIDAALRHEVAHVRRHDYASGAAVRILTALFWFHPVAWLAAARLRWFAEVACDAVAARSVGADRYARALLAFGRDAARSQPSLALGASCQLPRRLEVLMSDGDPTAHRWAVRATAALLLMLPASVLIRASAGVPVPATRGHQAQHQQRHAGLHHH